MQWIKAPDVSFEIKLLINKLKLDYIDCKKIICFRSYGSTSRARARIWSFPRVWQLALNLSPYYVVEVISQYFDKLSSDDKKRVLIHELLHIPKNFSGSLLSHRSRGGRIDNRRVENLFQQTKKI